VERKDKKLGFRVERKHEKLVERKQESQY